MSCQTLLLAVVAAGISGPAPARYLIQSHEVQRVAGTLTCTVSLENLQADEWVFFAAVAPELPGQVNVRTSLHPVGLWVQDQSPLRRCLLVGRVPIRTPKMPAALSVRVTYEATLRSRRLVTLPSSTPPPNVPDLPSHLRRMFLAEYGDLDFRTDSFRKWLQEKGFLRGQQESDMDFARRVFLAIRSGFSYEYRLGMDWRASAVAQARKSDCGGLSILFVSIMRANGIPARTLYGRWAASARPADQLSGAPYYQTHVKAEFFGNGVGWVPVDVASAILHDRSREGLRYFGQDAGDFLTFHVDPNLLLDTGLFGMQPLHNLQTPAWWLRGSGTLEPRSTSEDWQVRPLK